MSNILFNHKSACVVHKALEYKIQAKENMIEANIPDITDFFKEELQKEKDVFEHFTGIVFMLSLDKDESRNVNLGRKKAYILMHSLEDLIQVRKKIISENTNEVIFNRKVTLEVKTLAPIKTKIENLWGNTPQKPHSLTNDMKPEDFDRRYLDYYNLL
ncbi:hypothetical protein [Clostridium gasigenes]|uniref:Uncharacterized protein n=1 Tax=Clostridium gasigenes TaxID=94869 RepID=A0A1H0M435_9CLOT|nr:hypothetical protein [Clostridium gasigenes]MBB6622268.1 hypothetical protein [Clostridium gasigenes]MBU3087048.1 hypothetical protein [Clostridium gasigenes]MBU3134655.1 hypothetical protein [Clostridium gasigenes]SDO75144.1 hypothetical protein SAMN04488529_101313 [Clostridium gasigenes]